MHSDYETAPDVLKVVEETLRLEKRVVSSGKVRVRTIVENVDEIARASLDEEKVEITRVAIGKEIKEAPAIRTEGDVTIIPVLEEILVVEKRLVLTEELHIRRRVETEDIEVPITLRKGRAVVEEIPPQHTDRNSEHDL